MNEKKKKWRSNRYALISSEINIVGYIKKKSNLDSRFLSNSLIIGSSDNMMIEKKTILSKAKDVITPN